MNTLLNQIFPSLASNDTAHSDTNNADAPPTLLLVQRRDFEDPITYAIFADPVACEDGHTYDRPVIERCFDDRIAAEEARQRRERNRGTDSGISRDDVCCGGAQEPIELLSPISNQVVSGILVPNIFLEQQIIQIMENNIFGLGQEEIDDWQQRRNEKRIRDQQRHEKDRRERELHAQMQRSAQEAEQHNNSSANNNHNENRTTTTTPSRAQTYFAAPTSEPNRAVQVRVDRDIQIPGRSLSANDVGLSVVLVDDSALMPLSLFNNVGHLLRCTVGRCSQRLNQGPGSQQSWCARCARVVCVDCLDCDVTLISENSNSGGTNVAYLRTFGGQWLHRICPDCVSQMSEVVDRIDQSTDDRLRHANALMQHKLERHTDRFISRAVSLVDVITRHEASNCSNLIAAELEDNITFLENQRAQQTRRNPASVSATQAIERVEARIGRLDDRLKALPKLQKLRKQQYSIRIQPGVGSSPDVLHITPSEPSNRFPNTISFLRNVLVAKHRSFPKQSQSLSSKRDRLLKRKSLKQEMEHSYRRWLESMRENLERLLNAGRRTVSAKACEFLVLLDQTSRYFKDKEYDTLGTVFARNELSLAGGLKNSFCKASSYMGPKDGYAFKFGSRGLGYYVDLPSKQDSPTESSTSENAFSDHNISDPNHQEDHETKYGAALFSSEDNSEEESNKGILPGSSISTRETLEEDQKPAARPSLDATPEDVIQTARDDLDAIGSPLPFEWDLPLGLQYPTEQMSRGLEVLQDLVVRQQAESEQAVEQEWADYLQSLTSRQEQLQGRPQSSNCCRSAEKHKKAAIRSTKTRLEQLQERRDKQERDQVAQRHRQEEQATEELFSNAARSRKIGAEWFGGTGVLRMCGRCKAGPVENQACANLETHNDRSKFYKGHSVKSTKKPNHCPNCGWFNADYKQWPVWDGVYGPHQEIA